MVVRSESLHLLGVAAVVELGQGEASKVPEGDGLGQELFVFCVVAEHDECLAVEEVVQHAFGDYSAVKHCYGPKGIDDLAGLPGGIELEMLHNCEDHLGGILAHVLAGLDLEVVMGEDVLIAVEELIEGKDVLLVVPLEHQKAAQLGPVQLCAPSYCLQTTLAAQDIPYRSQTL